MANKRWKFFTSLMIDEKENKAIKLEVINKYLPFKDGYDVDGASDEIINSRYDASIELAKKEKKETKSLDSIDNNDFISQRQNMFEGDNK